MQSSARQYLLLISRDTDLDEIHQHELAEDRRDAEQGQTVADIEDRVLQRELPGQAVHCDDKLDTVGLQGEQCQIMHSVLFTVIPTFNRVLLFIS